MENKNNDIDLEIVMGDDSNLNFSEIKDCFNTLRPKDKTTKKKVIIPKSKNKKNNK